MSRCCIVSPGSSMMSNARFTPLVCGYWEPRGVCTDRELGLRRATGFRDEVAQVEQGAAAECSGFLNW